MLSDRPPSARLHVGTTVPATTLRHSDSEPLSQRFIRCRHCGLPHNLTDEVCPLTGKPIRRQPEEESKPPQVEKAGLSRHVVSLPHANQRKRSDPERSAVSPTAGNRRERGLVGRVIGEKYRVLELIGEGGMGTVYEAEHLEIGRHVAIKVLNRAHLGRKEAVARFHLEARAAGAIGHPNICEIYDVGRLEDGSPYLVMERLNGKTLADRINIEGALAFDDVLSILTQVLSALFAAHGKGIIHRDIKPENIFLTERVGCSPVAKILDFGISKSANDDADLSLTRTGMVMGTPYYMAPEQARGERIDHRVDIYACGVMLYEILTGRRPFIASSYNALVVQMLSVMPPDPREIRPAIPTGFVPIIYKALAKHRAERFEDAKAFIEALSEVESELGKGPTNAEIKRLAEEVRQSTRPPPALPPDGSDGLEIPVHFSETDSGHFTTLGTGEIEIDFETGPRPVEEDPTLVREQAFDEPSALSDRLVLIAPTEEEDASDTIVDPSGAMLGEIWSLLDRAQTDSSPGLEAIDEHSVQESRNEPNDDQERHGGRYSLISKFPKDKKPKRDSQAKKQAPHSSRAKRDSSDKMGSQRSPSAKSPRPTRPRLPSDPDEAEDDAVTTLFVSTDNGPREAANGEDRDSPPPIPRPPGTSRLS